MAEANLSEAPEQVPVQDANTAFQAFQSYSWDLDKDFLGGLVLALGGHRALAPTASQADIIMHSRIFYYARIRGITIPYSPYRAWLRAQLSSNPAAQQQQPQQQQQQPRIWEWELLQAMCSHRDRIAGAAASAQHTGAAEMDAWMRRLLLPDDGEEDAPAPAPQKPAWMAAAPRVELCVDRGGDGDGSGEQVPYPERFAAIIRAVQSGEPVEGIVEVPDNVARNPETTPFGKLQRPRKPWERDAPPAADGAGDGERPGWDGNPLDEKFPDPEEDAPAATV